MTQGNVCETRAKSRIQNCAYSVIGRVKMCEEKIRRKTKTSVVFLGCKIIFGFTFFLAFSVLSKFSIVDMRCFHVQLKSINK